ncbi:MAG: zinc-ribbon domain-containing protein [Bacteroidales bacterium]|nr:zinc-ribbon domain-containing protein [Bacteroidales bacterium]
MALINCFECGKEVSDKALSCPHCGVPFEKVSVATENISQISSNLEELKFPDLPADLSIGKQK